MAVAVPVLFAGFAAVKLKTVKKDVVVVKCVIKEVRDGVKSGIKILRDEVRSDIKALRHELMQHFHSTRKSQHGLHLL